MGYSGSKYTKGGDSRLE